MASHVKHAYIESSGVVNKISSINVVVLVTNSLLVLLLVVVFLFESVPHFFSGAGRNTYK